MFLPKSVPMLAATVSLLASGTPAYAFDNRSPSAGSVPVTSVAVDHPGGSAALALGLTAGGIVLAGGTFAAWQLPRRSRRTSHDTRPVIES